MFRDTGRSCSPYRLNGLPRCQTRNSPRGFISHNACRTSLVACSDEDNPGKRTRDTGGCPKLTEFATPGWRLSVRTYSHQYEFVPVISTIERVPSGQLRRLHVSRRKCAPECRATDSDYCRLFPDSADPVVGAYR